MVNKAITVDPEYVKWNMSLLEIGHYIAQYRATEGDKLSRPKNYTNSLAEIQKIAEEKLKNGNQSNT